MRGIIEIATDEQEIERENRRAAKSTLGESFRQPDPMGRLQAKPGVPVINWAKDGDLH